MMLLRVRQKIGAHSVSTALGTICSTNLRLDQRWLLQVQSELVDQTREYAWQIGTAPVATLTLVKIAGLKIYSRLYHIQRSRTHSRDQAAGHILSEYDLQSFTHIFIMHEKSLCFILQHA